MKKFLLFSFLTFALSTFAQDFHFTENFDAFNDGDRISQVQNIIRTWNNSASADAPISSEQSHSASNALKLFSNAQNGGPSDIIVPFSDFGKYTEGRVVVSFWMYVAADNEAYYNFQGDDSEGNIWATQFFSDKQGNFSLEDSERNVKATGQIPMGEWFKVSWDINLNSNFWRMSINDQLAGEFGNITNAVSMADFYPTAQSAPFNSLYYIDDLDVAHYPADTCLKNNAAVYQLSLAQNNLLEGGSTTGKANIKNVGQDPISSLMLKWTINGQEMTRAMDGLNLVNGETIDMDAPAAVIASKDNADVSVEILSVNGSADEDPTDNKRTVTMNIIVPAEFKKVLVEEATGTWCGWCPRGAVYMDSMSKLYPDYFVGVAVHGGRPSEPMKNDEHLNELRNLGYVDGFPKIVTMRAGGNDPLEITALFTEHIQQAPKTKVSVKKAEFDPDTRSLNVVVTAEFLERTRGSFRLGAILVEDSVTGNTAAYNQANYYSGGNRGKMGGYENLPNPVPYSQMVYNHVSRSVFSAVKGVAAKTRKANAGEIIEQEFTLENIPEEWDEGQFKIAAFATISSSKIDNADEAEVKIISAAKDIEATPNIIRVSPNPFTQQTNIVLDIRGTKDIRIALDDINGQTILQRNYGKVSGKSVFPLIYPELSKGVYLLHITIGSEHYTKKLVKQ